MPKGTVSVKGFDELSRQIKKLGDSPKRTEILAIQRKISRPLVVKAKAETPVGKTGRLKKSIGFKRGKSRNVIQSWVEPKIKAGDSRKNSGAWRSHFVHDGTKVRIAKKGGNRGAIKANPFLERAYNSLKSHLVSGYRIDMTKYIQKKIDKLSTK